MSRYIRFVIENVAPVRIANDETSQHGQTDTLKYIPGSNAARPCCKQSGFRRE